MKKESKTKITEVKDFTGNPVRIGDKIVYIEKGPWRGTAELAFGTVSGLSKAFGKKCAVIENDYGGKSKPTSQSIYKVG